MLAEERGLATCVQEAWGNMGDVVRASALSLSRRIHPCSASFLCRRTSFVFKACLVCRSTSRSESMQRPRSEICAHLLLCKIPRHCLASNWGGHQSSVCLVLGSRVGERRPLRHSLSPTRVLHGFVGNHLCVRWAMQAVWCGISLGFADTDDPVNTLRSEREPLENVCVFRGFETARL